MAIIIEARMIELQLNVMSCHVRHCIEHKTHACRINRIDQPSHTRLKRYILGGQGCLGERLVPETPMQRYGWIGTERELRYWCSCVAICSQPLSLELESCRRYAVLIEASGELSTGGGGCQSKLTACCAKDVIDKRPASNSRVRKRGGSQSYDARAYSYDALAAAFVLADMDNEAEEDTEPTR